MRPKWYPDWEGQTIVIVASGPTAGEVPLGLGRERARFIAVNESWRLCPWAEILFAGDHQWWLAHNGCPEFLGMKVSIDRLASGDPDWGIHRLRCNRGGSDTLEVINPGTVGWGGHSGFNALNLAAQLSPSKIILVGYDIRVDLGDHWHGSHPEGMENPRHFNLPRWRRSVDGASGPLARLGIRVFNCSPVSNLRRYPKVTFQEALDA